MGDDPRKLDAEALRDHTRSLRRLARALVKDEHAADDVVQDAFVTALDRPPKQGFSLGSWLAGITRNHARDKEREDRRRQARERRAARAEAVEPDDSLECVDLLRHLLDHVRSLDEPYRSTVLLRYFDGLSAREVAKRHAVPYATVRTRLARAVRELRERMDASTGGQRRVWLVPMIPFAAARDGGALAALAEGLRQVGELGHQGVMAVMVKKQLVGAGLAIVAGVFAVTTVWQPFATVEREATSGAGVLEQRDAGGGAHAGPSLVAEEFDREAARPTSAKPRASGGVVARAKPRRELPGAGSDVTGRVTNKAGSPIEGARVRNWAKGSVEVMTDAEGLFRIRALDQGYLYAIAEGYVGSWHRVVIDGEALEHDIVLERGARVRGVVYGTGHRPVAGANITLGEKAALHAVSDEHGAFEFDAVGKGKQPLAVRHGDYAADLRTIDVPRSGRDLVLSIELGPGRAIAGIVRGVHGKPVAGARIEVAREWRRIDHCQSGEDGRFELARVPEGELRLTCRAKGHVIDTMAVHAGMQDLVITLAKSARIAGRVVDSSTGAPVEEFTVRLVPDRRSKLSKAGGYWDWIAKGHRFATHDGAWDTGDTAFPDGFVTRVEVEAPGYARGVAARAVARADARPEDLRIELDKGTTLRGRVVIGRTGQPVTGASIRIVRRDAEPPRAKKTYRPRAAKSDANGSFVLENVAPGGLRLVVEHPKAGIALHELTIPRGTPGMTTTVQMTEGGSLAAEVRGADGKPVAGTKVTISAVNVPGLGSRSWRDKTDSRGRVTFERLPPGVYRLARVESVGPKALETYARHVRINEGKRSTVVLTAAGKATLRGRLRFAGIVPERVWLRVVPVQSEDVTWERRRSPRWIVADNGSFAVEGLGTGRYRIEAGPGGYSGSADITVEGAGEKRVEVRLSRRPSR